MGHIRLISTCYNPFAIKLLQKLLKAKCLHCDRLRVVSEKMELFLLRLKLIKRGFLVEAAQLGAYTDFGMASIEASIQILRKKLNIKTGKTEDGEPTNEDKDQTLTALEAFSEQEKQKREELASRIQAIIEEEREQPVTSSAATIATRKLVKEVMASVVPGRCPHCKARIPRIRKEGAIKFFQMPLSKKDAKSNRENLARPDLRLDSSTIGAFSESDEDEEDVKEEQEQKEEGGSDRKQQYLNPLEVREHMRRLWAEAGALLEPLFGSFEIFFINSLLVSPNRFRPESKGGKQSGGDSDFLHAHSAMLNKILDANLMLRKAIETKEKLIPEDEKDRHDTASERSKAQSTEISKKEVTSKDVIRRWIDLQETIN